MKKVAIVGAGIVGLSVAYFLFKQGAQVTVIDRDPTGDKTSFGNAGSIAVMEVNPAAVPGVFWKVPVWMMNPLGPLAVKPSYVVKLLPWLYQFWRAGKRENSKRLHQALTVLNRRVFDDLLPLFKDVGLLDKLHRHGALIVYESDYGFKADKAMWTMREEAGIEVRYLSASAARELEPALGDKVRHAVFTPQAAFVNDPKLIVDELRQWLIVQGVQVVQGEVVEVIVTDKNAPLIALSDGRNLPQNDVVIAAGVWSKSLADKLGERSYVESERGYNTTIQSSGVMLSHEVIFAERKFVVTPLSCGLRIGGAAEFGGLNNPPNYKRCSALTALAKMYFPTLNSTQGVPWAGHRPSTPDSLPIIGRSPRHRHIFYAFGHGHLGLTQSATTGRLIANFVFEHHNNLDLTPYSIARFN